MPDFAADSKERTAVVPMAIMRPPLALVWLILSTKFINMLLHKNIDFFPMVMPCY
jgi:hypothetical protein